MRYVIILQHYLGEGSKFLQLRKRRAIIIDDDANILKLLKDFFSIRDYDVLTFDSPITCTIYENKLASCANSKPCADILITDYQMPKMTGLELLVQQAQRGCKVDIRNKALMSGNLDAETQNKVKELGHAFFSKPFNFPEFISWIEDCESRIDLSRPIGIARKEERQAADIDVLYTYEASEKTYRSTVINFSNSGLCLKMHNPISEGQSIMLKTEVPNNCRNASVRWVRKMEDNFYLAGFACC